MLEYGAIEIHRDPLDDDSIPRRTAEVVMDALLGGIAAARRRAVDRQRGRVSDPNSPTHGAPVSMGNGAA